MMAQVNLLPASIRAARRRARRLRAWAVAVIISVVVSLIPVGFNVVQQARAADFERKVQQLSAKLKQTNAQLVAHSEQVATLSQQLARADALRTKRPWAPLLAVVTDALADDAWLEKIESIEGGAAAQTSSSGTSASGEAKNPGSVVRLEGPSGLRLHGYAGTHEGLYRLMARLKETRIFERVEMVQAQREPVLAGEAVRFSITCTW